LLQSFHARVDEEERAMGTEATASDVDRLVAVEEIRRLIYDYAFHLDMNHPDALADLFVEDCEVVYGPGFGAEGREAYRKTLDGIGEFFQATSHHVTNVVIDFSSDDEATARSVLYAWHRYHGERPDGHVWGQYHDDFVRSDGCWRFKRRELRAAGTAKFHVKSMIPIGRA
jgi:ketosteroid isomerase-like protein